MESGRYSMREVVRTAASHFPSLLKKSYLVIRRNKIVPLAGKWIELEVVLSEISQTQKDKYIFLVCVIWVWVRALLRKVDILRKSGRWQT